jgi:hypothetical protein
MSYKDIDGVSYWISEREQDLSQNVDPYKKAAELFACDVEVYLYREVNPDGSANPLYQNPDFLAWAIARYDACKSGSGGSWHDKAYDSHDPSLLGPVPPAGRRNYDAQIRPVEPPSAAAVDTKGSDA